MAETAKVNAAQDEWERKYGFRHECRCDVDFATDNTGTVTECWANMAEDALETCKRQQAVLREIAQGIVEDPIALAQEHVIG